MARFYIPKGTTEQQKFQVKDENGDAVDYTGMDTPTLDVVDKDGTTVSVTGAVAWVDAATGQWGYTPDGQLTDAASPYRVRVSITDGSSVQKSPNGATADMWHIIDDADGLS